MCYIGNCASIAPSSSTSPQPSSAVPSTTTTTTTTTTTGKVQSTTPIAVQSTPTTDLPPTVSNVTELPEELTTIIEIEETDGNSTESLDFVNLPGYGVIDDANSTANASQFSCYNRRYGYYADIAKKCYMFHLCYPVQEPTSGQLIFQRFSFVCSDNAVFDQQNLVCVDNETLSYPCSEAHKYFVESNNKLIESMQQNAAAMTQPGQQPGLPPQLNGATAASASGQVISNADGAGDDGSVVGLPNGSAALMAAESAELPMVNSTMLDADAAAQYALLEQLFG